MIKLGIYLAEKGLIPDFILNFFIQKISLARVNSASTHNEKLTVINQLKSGPIAEKTSDANDQHYEVPPEFFELVLGKHMKYSCSHFGSELDDLDHAEEAMLKLYIDRAGIDDNQNILDLGCGWGSFSLYAAAKFPSSKFTAVSNSKDQINFINAEAQKRDLKNLIATQKNINEMHFNETFDKVISIEMFEHMRNYESLLNKVSNFLKPSGELFVHIFCHRFACYLYEAKNESDWMTKNFFEGGIMPSEDIFSNFENDLKVVRSWKVNGTHYGLTSKKWLEKHDTNKSKIISMFDQHYGNGKTWFFRWRMFFLTCAEFFSINEGNDWFVSHYLLKKKSEY
jgi:cyclopropane-fatty-acyl-phospholipid synthase